MSPSVLARNGIESVPAIDNTTIPYYEEVAGMTMISGTKDRDGRAFTFTMLPIIG